MPCTADVCDPFPTADTCIMSYESLKPQSLPQIPTSNSCPIFLVAPQRFSPRATTVMISGNGGSELISTRPVSFSNKQSRSRPMTPFPKRESSSLDQASSDSDTATTRSNTSLYGSNASGGGGYGCFGRRPVSSTFSASGVNPLMAPSSTRHSKAPIRPRELFRESSALTCDSDLEPLSTPASLLRSSSALLLGTTNSSLHGPSIATASAIRASTSGINSTPRAAASTATDSDLCTGSHHHNLASTISSLLHSAATASTNPSSSTSLSLPRSRSSLRARSSTYVGGHPSSVTFYNMSVVLTIPAGAPAHLIRVVRHQDPLFVRVWVLDPASPNGKVLGFEASAKRAQTLDNQTNILFVWWNMLKTTKTEVSGLKVAVPPSLPSAGTPVASPPSPKLVFELCSRRGFANLPSKRSVLAEMSLDLSEVMVNQAFQHRIDFGFGLLTVTLKFNHAHYKGSQARPKGSASLSSGNVNGMTLMGLDILCSSQLKSILTSATSTHTPSASTRTPPISFLEFSRLFQHSDGVGTPLNGDGTAAVQGSPLDISLYRFPVTSGV